jgi:hypothetical protein
MDHGTEAHDPFEGMTSAERKRTYERLTLEMIYNPTEYEAIIDQERPDFAIQRHKKSRPFGVEITNLFQDESAARLNMIHGYTQQLFDGGPFRGRQDARRLSVPEVTITDKDGNVKAQHLRVIMRESATPDQFRSRLAEVIREKTARGYATSALSHLNLIILDWFHLRFNPRDYLSTDFLDDNVRHALRESPFRDVFLIVQGGNLDRNNDATGPVSLESYIVPLQQLLLMESYYLAAGAIHHNVDATSMSVAEFVQLVAHHLTVELGLGVPVIVDDTLYVNYQSAQVSMNDEGLVVIDNSDLPFQVHAVEINCPLPGDVKEAVTKFISDHAFGTGYVRNTRRLEPIIRPDEPR